MRRAHLEDAKLSAANLAVAGLVGAILGKADLIICSLINTDLEDTALNGASKD